MKMDSKPAKVSNSKKRSVWGERDAQILLELWAKRATDLRRAKRNGHIYQEIAVQMNNKFSTEEVHVKIRNFTQRYREEKKKVGHSGGSPSNWKFYQDVHRIIGNTASNSAENLESFLYSSDTDFDQDNDVQPANKIKKLQEGKTGGERMNMEVSQAQTESDSFEYLGLAWAAKLRKMQPAQSRIAERLISEVLFQGDVGMLTFDTTVQKRGLASTNFDSENFTSNVVPTNRLHSNLNHIPQNSLSSRRTAKSAEVVAQQTQSLSSFSDRDSQEEEIITPKAEQLYESSNSFD